MHIHSLKRAATAACVLAALAAAPASAATVTTQLRVEANGHDLDPGWRYAHDSVSYSTSESAACGGTGDEKSIAGPSALGLLLQGGTYNGALAFTQVSDQFEFGQFVCAVGPYESSSSRYWLYKVDHVAAEVGADQFTIEPTHDQVLWYFVDSAAGVNTGNELGLVADQRDAQVGTPVRVGVAEYGLNGEFTPAAGVRILGGDGAVTDELGFATLVFETAGRPVIRGIRGSDIPTDALRLCIWEDSADECAGAMQGRIVGTGEGDTLRGTAARERIVARGGPDTINSRDTVRDIVHCGAGRDTVRADRLDRVRRDCERVARR
jgi:Ca2+-binding RTX toxin-like protein